MDSSEDGSSQLPANSAVAGLDGATVVGSCSPTARQLITVFLISLAIYHANFDEFHQVDTVPAPYVAWSLVHEHTFDLTSYISHLEGYQGSVIVRGPHGHWISFWPPGSAIMAVPFYGVASLFTHEIPKKSRMLRLGKTVGATYSALAVAVFFAIASRLFPASALLATILFGFGTTVWSTASQSLWSHGPAVFWVCIAWLVLMSPRREGTYQQGILAGLALGAAVMCRPTMGILLVVLAGWLMIYKNWRPAIGLVLGSIVPVAVLVLYMVHYTGILTSGGYAIEIRSNWVSPLWLGLAGVTVAPSRGILFYTPAVVVAFFGAVKLLTHSSMLSPLQRDVLTGGILGAVVTIMVYAKWEGWHGGWSYGPRYLTEIMPAICLLFAMGDQYLPSARAKRLASLLVYLSVAVHFVGVFGHDSAWHARHYQPPHYLDLFQIEDNQISSALSQLIHRVTSPLSKS